MNSSFNSVSSHNSSNKITKLIEKINSTADALLSALDINGESVSSYGFSIGTKMVLNNEFVDRVVFTMKEMKNHLQDIQDAIMNNTFDNMDNTEEIAASLQDTYDKLDSLMIENNGFRNTYEYAIEEIKDKINQVKNALPVYA